MTCYSGFKRLIETGYIGQVCMRDWIIRTALGGGLVEKDGTGGEVGPAPRGAQDKAMNLTWFRGGGWDMKGARGESE
jgi:hypothetical protein